MRRDANDLSLLTGRSVVTGAAALAAAGFALPAQATVRLERRAADRAARRLLADGSINVTRWDIYSGGRLSWVPFTKLEGDVIKGTHRGR